MKEKLDINLSKPKKYRFNVLDFLIVVIALSIIFVFVWQHGVFKSRTIVAEAKITFEICNVEQNSATLANGMKVYNRNDNSLLGQINGISLAPSKEYSIKDGKLEYVYYDNLNDITFELKDVKGKCNRTTDFFMLSDGNYITVGDKIEIIKIFEFLSYNFLGVS